MSVNVELKEVLKFFQKTSFRIAFLIGMIILKTLSINYSNEVAQITIDILLVLSFIFFADIFIDVIRRKMEKKKLFNNLKKSIYDLNQCQVRVLVSNYFEIENNNIKVEQVGYFDVLEGLPDVLATKGILIRSTLGSLYDCPFTINDLAYKELCNSVRDGRIAINVKKNNVIIKWFNNNYDYQKDELGMDHEF